MSQSVTDFNLQQWVEKAFQGSPPSHIKKMVQSQSTKENVVEEMLTQLPSETRAAVEKLYEMHEAETALLYAVIEELFLRHLKGHPLV